MLLDCLIPLSKRHTRPRVWATWLRHSMPHKPSPVARLLMHKDNHQTISRFILPLFSFCLFSTLFFLICKINNTYNSLYTLYLTNLFKLIPSQWDFLVEMLGRHILFGALTWLNCNKFYLITAFILYAWQSQFTRIVSQFFKLFNLFILCSIGD